MLQRQFKRYCFLSDFRITILLLRKQANKVDTFLFPTAACLVFGSEIFGVMIFLKQQFCGKQL